MRQKLVVKWRIKLGPGLARNEDFAKGKGLEPKVKKFFKIV